MAIRVDTKKKLEDALSKVGISGEWINQDKYGFSRTYKFNACGTDVIIVWWCNYSTVRIGNAEMWFTHIDTYTCYPMRGEWIEFTYNGEQPLHLKIKE